MRFSNILSVLTVTVLMTGSAIASPLACGATGFVNRGSYIYRLSNGSFQNINWTWYDNYYARILKSVSASIVDSDGKVLQKNQKFDLVSESDSRGCDVQAEWVLDSDFIAIHQ